MAGAGRAAANLSPIGDANGVNSQSIALPVPSQSTPVSVKAADVVSLALVTRYKQVSGKKVPRSVSLVLTLADTPSEQVLYEVQAEVPSGCDGGSGTSLLAQYTAVTTIPVSSVSCNVSGSTDAGADLALGDAVVSGRTITWEVDGGALKKGAVIDTLRANTSVFVLGVFDEASSDAVYRYQ